MRIPSFISHSRPSRLTASVERVREMSHRDEYDSIRNGLSKAIHTRITREIPNINWPTHAYAVAIRLVGDQVYTDAAKIEALSDCVTKDDLKYRRSLGRGDRWNEVAVHAFAHHVGSLFNRKRHVVPMVAAHDVEALTLYLTEGGIASTVINSIPLVDDVERMKAAFDKWVEYICDVIKVSGALNDGKRPCSMEILATPTASFVGGTVLRIVLDLKLYDAVDFRCSECFACYTSSIDLKESMDPTAPLCKKCNGVLVSARPGYEKTMGEMDINRLAI